MSDSKPLVWLKGEIKTPPFSHEARLRAGFLTAEMADTRRTTYLTTERTIPDVRRGLETVGVDTGNVDIRRAVSATPIAKAREVIEGIDVCRRRTTIDEASTSQQHASGTHRRKVNPLIGHVPQDSRKVTPFSLCPRTSWSPIIPSSTGHQNEIWIGIGK
jgi:hypothetical protein